MFKSCVHNQPLWVDFPVQSFGAIMPSTTAAAQHRCDVELSVRSCIPEHCKCTGLDI